MRRGHRYYRQCAGESGSAGEREGGRDRAGLRPRPFRKCTALPENDKGSLSGGTGDRRQRCNGRGNKGADRGRCGCGKSGYRSGFHLYDQNCGRYRRASDHGDYGVLCGGEGIRHSCHCGRRHQVFRRYDKGNRGRRRRLHDGFHLCGL